MNELFFYSNGIVHMEFISESATVKKTATKRSLAVYAIYFAVSDLSFGVQRIDCCYTTTPLHSSRGTCKTTGNSFATLSVLTWSLTSFFLFPRMKAVLLWRRFHSSEEVMTATSEAVWDLPANIFQRCFLRCFQQQYKSWQMSITINGDYFEGGCGSA